MINEEKDEAMMELAAKKAADTMKRNIGGPFGATITRGNEIVCIESNRVLANHDPTAHAEVTAIRKACEVLGTYDLSDCTIYCTGSPCPMCLGAIIWAGIKDVVISGLPEDADAIGFKDDFMYKFIQDKKCDDSSVLKMRYVNRDIAKQLYRNYTEITGVIY